MDFSIALILAQDGITTGAVYALLAVGLVLVFAVTRVIFIPQGEMVAYGALTIATLQAGMFPATAWLLAAMGVVVFAIDILRRLRKRGEPVSITCETRRFAAATHGLPGPMTLATFGMVCVP